MFFNVVCISWKIKCWILLMHGVTMKFICTVFYIMHTIHRPKFIIKIGEHFFPN